MKEKQLLYRLLRHFSVNSQGNLVFNLARPLNEWDPHLQSALIEWMKTTKAADCL